MTSNMPSRSWKNFEGTRVTLEKGRNEPNASPGLR